ncbi:MAG TPA: hypothetical protein ENI69_05805 [Rhodospirillales bacterium]|nr:hypothetical protein [Rhodospirillales bacterium]
MWKGLTEGAWLYQYEVKFFNPANALAVRLENGNLVVLSPPGDVPESCFTELQKKGEIVALIAPHAGHVQGRKLWQRRYPQARFHAPETAHSHLTGTVAPLSEIAPSIDIEFRPIPGTKRGGTLVRVERPPRPVVYIDEVIGNQPSLPGLLVIKLLFWITGSAPGIRVNKIFTSMLCHDARAVAAAALEILAGDPIVVPAHGEPIDNPGDLAKVQLLLQSLID